MVLGGWRKKGRGMDKKQVLYFVVEMRVCVLGVRSVNTRSGGWGWRGSERGAAHERKALGKSCVRNIRPSKRYDKNQKATRRRCVCVCCAEARARLLSSVVSKKRGGPLFSEDHRKEKGRTGDEMERRCLGMRCWGGGKAERAGSRKGKCRGAPRGSPRRWAWG